MENKNRFGYGILLVVLALLVAPFVLASGPSTPYWLTDGNEPANPLILTAGESKDFTINLQNEPGNADENWKVAILNGSEVLTRTDSTDTYLVTNSVPQGTLVHFRASVPEGTPIGTSYRVALQFSGSPVSSSGTFQFGSGVLKQFDVIVGEPKPVVAPAEQPNLENEPKGVNYGLVILVLAILIVIVIVVIVAKKKKDSKN